MYAADGENRIEKRPVTLGKRDEARGTVAILEGLSFLDRIAFPDESVQVGMAVSETAYVPDDMGMDPSDLGGMDMPDMPDVPDMDMPETDMPEAVVPEADTSETDMPEAAPSEGAAG